MKTMTFAKFFETDNVMNELSNFYEHLNKINTFNEELKDVNDHNLKIINNMEEIINKANDSNWLTDFIERGKYHAPKNTPKTPLIDYLNPEKLAEIIFNAITKVLWMCWQAIVSSSYYLALIVAMFGVLSYIFGYKKGAQFAGIAYGFYFLIKILNMCFGG